MKNEKTGANALTIQFEPELWSRIEEFRVQSRPIPSAGEAARRLMKRGLASVEKERDAQIA